MNACEILVLTYMRDLQRLAAQAGFMAAAIVVVAATLNPAVVRMFASRNVLVAAAFGVPSISIVEHPTAAPAGDFYHPGPPQRISWKSKNAPPDSRVFLYLVSENGEDEVLLAAGQPQSGTFVWTPRGPYCLRQGMRGCDFAIGGPGNYTVRAELYTPSDACYGEVCPGKRLVMPTIVAASVEAGVMLSSTSLTSTGSVLGATTDGTQTDSIGVPGGLNFNITWDLSVASAPPDFKTAVLVALNNLVQDFSISATLGIRIGYGGWTDSDTGQSYLIPPSSLGQAFVGEYYTQYALILYALQKNAVTPDAKLAVSTLPATNPAWGEFTITSAGLKALNYYGLYAPNAIIPSYDGSIGIAITPPYPSTWCYFSNLSNNGCADTDYDFQSVVLHEVTHVMGRVCAPVVSYNELYQLFNYRGSGIRNMNTVAGGGYFSIDGGATQLATFRSGDPTPGECSWNGSNPNDPFNSVALPGKKQISEADMKVIDVLGYQRKGPDTTPPSTPALSAIVVSSTEVDLIWTPSIDPAVAGQSTSGLAGYNILQGRKQIRLAPPGDTSFDVTGLRGGTKYTFKINAFDEALNPSSFSSVTVTTPKSTGKPQ
jgi:hypothetical protein